VSIQRRSVPAVAAFCVEEGSTSAANDSTGICQAEGTTASLWPLSATTVLRAECGPLAGRGHQAAAAVAPG